MDVLRDIILVLMYIFGFLGVISFMIGLFAAGVQCEPSLQPLRKHEKDRLDKECGGGIMAAIFLLALSAMCYGLYKLTFMDCANFIILLVILTIGISVVLQFKKQ